MIGLCIRAFMLIAAVLIFVPAEAFAPGRSAGDGMLRLSFCERNPGTCRMPSELWDELALKAALVMPLVERAACLSQQTFDGPGASFGGPCRMASNRPDDRLPRDWTAAHR